MYIKTSSYNLNMYSFNSSIAAATAAKSLQSCPTLCDPIDGSPPSSPVPGILQARTLEWVAISFSKYTSINMEETALPLKKKKNTFIFINFWLPWVFTAMLGLVWLRPVGATPHCSTQASHCSGFSC